MSRLEDLDEEVLAIVLRSGLINLNNPGTQYEVSQAIDTALGIASDEQINIAIMRSVQNQVRASASTSATTTEPPAAERDTEQPTWIAEAERKRILVHLQAVADSGDEADERKGRDTGDVCSICLEATDPDRQIKLPCGHVWCKKCLCRQLVSGLGPGAVWPPKCCDPLDESTIAWLDLPDVLRLWLQARQQNETPVGEQVHCARPACGEFIPARPGEQTDAACLVCGDNTCRACRRASHPGRPCTEEAEDEMLKDLMDEKGWSSCPRCSRIIELTAGCNHVTCRCGAEFCFLCGEPFRFTHQCPRYGNGRGQRVPVRERRSQYHQRQEDEGNRASEARQETQEPDRGGRRFDDIPWNFGPFQAYAVDETELRSAWRPEEARRRMQMMNQMLMEDDFENSSTPNRPWPGSFVRCMQMINQRLTEDDFENSSTPSRPWPASFVPQPGLGSRRPSSRSMQPSTTVVDPFGNSWAQNTPFVPLTQHTTADQDEEVGTARASTGAAPEGLEQGLILLLLH
ncbi:E3 ubiquitin-protein ligase ARI9 like [Verticillium longisporum]|nr:E3 ubiquitin-protein ligase ARI9 like [Verticillium longisporum]